MNDFTEKTRKEFTKIGYILSVIITLIIEPLSMKLIPSIDQKKLYVWFIILAPMNLIAVPIFLWLMKKIPNVEKDKVKKMSFKQIIVVGCIFMAAAYILNIVAQSTYVLINIIKNYFPSSRYSTQDLQDSLQSSGLILKIIFIGILGPIIEEITFRWILLDKLRIYGDKTAILFTSIVFALYHGYLPQSIYAFGIGLLLAYIAIKTNTIRYTILYHILINILGSLLIPELILTKNLILAIIAIILMISMIITGITLFIINFKKINFESKKDEVYIKDKRKVIYGNSGMILFYMISIGIIIFDVIIN